MFAFLLILCYYLFVWPFVIMFKLIAWPFKLMSQIVDRIEENRRQRELKEAFAEVERAGNKLADTLDELANSMSEADRTQKKRNIKKR